MQMASAQAHWGGLKTSWVRRAKLASDWIAGEPSVCDVGCGNMYIRGLLGASTKYVGIDIVRRDEETIVVDLNKEELPVVDMPCGLALGVCEYIIDPAHFYRQLRQFQTVVTSYNHYSIQDLYWKFRRKKRAVDWINRFTRKEFLKIVTGAGFEIAGEKKIQLGEHIYLLKRRPMQVQSP